MDINAKVSAFLGRHNFSPAGYDINTVIDGLLYDMKEGLKNGTGNLDSMAAAQDMIPTWGMPPAESPKQLSLSTQVEQTSVLVW